MTQIEALEQALEEATEAGRKAQDASYHATRALYAAQLAVEVAAGREGSIVARLARNYLGPCDLGWEEERNRLLAEQRAEERARQSANEASV